ncbi:hypothetical protein [Halobacillus sp. Nhm2S1]|uniref:hypothetical protein n=1 Tax=Halobacillus sp. Nhm2S1 TaxID=2866716 RepID=UPI001C739A7A|nr:hypothetical protein [Halobacillus sp. Nhm2S1]MBX0357695.1 hypothetical protein [Halobacillus sp. Nhm2S1]
MDSLIWVLSWIFLFGFVFFLIAGVVSLIKKKRKKALKLFGISIGSVAGIIGLILISIQFSSAENQYGEVAEGTELSDRGEEESVELDKNSFNISLKTSDYNVEENSFHVEYETGLPEGTVVEIARFSTSFPDSWGEQYDPYFSYTLRLIPEEKETTVKDGLITYTYENADFNGLLLPNSILYTTININSTGEVNSFIKEQIGSEDEFNQKYSELINTMEEKGQDFFASENDEGLKVYFYDNYEIKDAHPIDDIYAHYKTEQISYKELEKNPSKYEGTPLSFTGEVLQIQTEEVDNSTFRYLDNYSVIRLAIDGDLDQVVYVTVEDADGMEGIVSEDTITVYGEMTGSKTYESVAGYEITIPSMDAVLYEE